jgi:hypothetical protein
LIWVKTFHRWSKQFDPQPDNTLYGRFFYHYWGFTRVLFIGAIIIFGGAVVWMVAKLIAFLFFGQTP